MYVFNVGKDNTSETLHPMSNSTHELYLGRLFHYFRIMFLKVSRSL